MDGQRPAGIDDRGDRRSRRRRRWRRLGIGLGLAVAVGLVVLQRPLLRGNLGAVAPGLVYRCAQPKGNLGELIAECRPRSILNLRGGSYRDDWYDAEVRAALRDGIDFYDFPMSATERPSRRELLTLIDLFGRCRYPLLIHCKSGSDRTGLASGLYLLTRAGLPPERAEAAFSVFYGHFPIGGPEHLHEPFDEYRRWLDAEGRDHSPERFRDWVARDYRDERPKETGPLVPLSPGPRIGPPPRLAGQGGAARR